MKLIVYYRPEGRDNPHYNIRTMVFNLESEHQDNEMLMLQYGIRKDMVIGTETISKLKSGSISEKLLKEIANDHE